MVLLRYVNVLPESVPVRLVDGVPQRYIRLFAPTSFGIVLLIACETSSVTLRFSLVKSGPAVMLYGSVFSGIGTTLVTVLLAQIASMLVVKLRRKFLGV